MKETLSENKLVDLLVIIAIVLAIVSVPLSMGFVLFNPKDQSFDDKLFWMRIASDSSFENIIWEGKNVSYNFLREQDLVTKAGEIHKDINVYKKFIESNKTAWERLVWFEQPVFCVGQDYKKVYDRCGQSHWILSRVDNYGWNLYNATEIYVDLKSRNL